MTRSKSSHTHLFPGAIIESAGEGPELLITFADGVEAAADLIDDGGRPALVVEAYTTAAGTAIPRKMWLVRAREADGDAVRLKLGQALPLE